MERKRKTPAQHREFAKAVVSGSSLREAMIGAGWSEKQAHKGRAAVSSPMIQALAVEGLEFARIGAKLDPRTVEQTIEGRLYTNAVMGESKGNEACKLLGTMKKHNLFQSDSTVGVIVIQPSDRSERLLKGLAGELEATFLPSEE